MTPCAQAGYDPEFLRIQYRQRFRNGDAACGRRRRSADAQRDEDRVCQWRWTKRDGFDAYCDRTQQDPAAKIDCRAAFLAACFRIARQLRSALAALILAIALRVD